MLKEFNERFERVQEKWMQVVGHIEENAAHLFGWQGRYVANHPCIIILLSTTFACVLGYFIQFMPLETNQLTLFAPLGTQSMKNYDKYQNTWRQSKPTQNSSSSSASTKRIFTVIISQNTQSNSNNMYTVEATSQLLNLHNYTTQEEISININRDKTENNTMFTVQFNDICDKWQDDHDDNHDSVNIEKFKRSISCMLEYFDFNQTVINATFNILDGINNRNNSEIIQTGDVVTCPISHSMYTDRFDLIYTRIGYPFICQNVTQNLSYSIPNSGNTAKSAGIVEHNYNYTSYYYYGNQSGENSMDADFVEIFYTQSIPILKTTPAYLCQYTTSTDNSFYHNPIDGNILDDWEYQIVDLLNNLNNNQFKSKGFSISYASEKSLSWEVERVTSIETNLPYFGAATIILCLFSSIVVTKCKRRKKSMPIWNNKYNYNNCWCCCLGYEIDRKRSRTFLALLGIFSTFLSIIATFGFVGGIMKIPFNSVVGAAPLLLIGIDVDDMYVILRAFDLTNEEQTVSKRMQHALKDAGLSMFLTSLTDLIAFILGSFSPFNIIYAFCWYVGIGIVFDFLFEMTFFAAFLTYHARKESYNQCGCCQFCKILTKLCIQYYKTQNVNQIEIELETNPPTTQTSQDQDHIHSDNYDDDHNQDNHELSMVSVTQSQPYLSQISLPASGLSKSISLHPPSVNNVQPSLASADSLSVSVIGGVPIQTGDTIDDGKQHSRLHILHHKHVKQQKMLIN